MIERPVYMSELETFRDDRWHVKVLELEDAENPLCSFNSCKDSRQRAHLILKCCF